jgi:exoribonuclease II
MHVLWQPGHPQVKCYKKLAGLNVKFENLQKQQDHPKNNGTAFSKATSKSLHAHTSSSDWIVDSSCTHHMARDASLFSSLDIDKKNDKTLYWE